MIEADITICTTVFVLFTRHQVFPFLPDFMLRIVLRNFQNVSLYFFVFVFYLIFVFFSLVHFLWHMQCTIMHTVHVFMFLGFFLYSLFILYYIIVLMLNQEFYCMILHYSSVLRMIFRCHQGLKSFEEQPVESWRLRNVCSSILNTESLIIFHICKAEYVQGRNYIFMNCLSHLSCMSHFLKAFFHHAN